MVKEREGEGEIAFFDMTAALTVERVNFCSCVKVDFEVREKSEEGRGCHIVFWFLFFFSTTLRAKLSDGIKFIQGSTVSNPFLFDIKYNFSMHD